MLNTVSTRELRRRVHTPRSCEFRRSDTSSLKTAESWLKSKLRNDIEKLEDRLGKLMLFTIRTRITASESPIHRRVIVEARP